MKKILIAIILTTALISCSKGHEPQESADLIKFGSVSTRAVISNASQIDEFAVFAEQNLGPDDTPEANQWISLLDEERVYRDSDNDYVYDNKRYWVKDRTFFFFGVYPYGTNVTRTGDDESFEYSFDLTLPMDADTDFMVAQCSVPVLADIQEYPIVGMPFEHLLAKVSFNIKQSGEYNASDKFIVTQVGLSGVSRNAHFVASHSPNSYTESLSVVQENRQIRRSNLNSTLTTSGVDVLGANEGLMVMPQTLSEGQVKLSIAYSYQQADDTEIQYMTHEVNIPAETVREWKSGKAYNYGLTLKIDNNIYINTPTVTDWGSYQPSGTIIIR